MKRRIKNIIKRPKKAMNKREYYKQCAVKFFNNKKQTDGIVGHHQLNLIKVRPSRGNGNPEYIWCIDKTNDTKIEYVASELLPGVFYCHLTNQVIEWPRDWVITFGEAEYIEIIIDPTI